MGKCTMEGVRWGRHVHDVVRDSRNDGVMRYASTRIWAAGMTEGLTRQPDPCLRRGVGIRGSKHETVPLPPPSPAACTCTRSLTSFSSGVGLTGADMASVRRLVRVHETSANADRKPRSPAPRFLTAVPANSGRLVPSPPGRRGCSGSHQTSVRVQHGRGSEWARGCLSCPCETGRGPSGPVKH